MCPSQKLLNKTKNGVLTFCGHSKLFQLNYNNLCFELYEWELDALKEYLYQIDASYWEQQLTELASSRKIPVSVGIKHFIILLNKVELLEIRHLLQTDYTSVHLLTSKEIEYVHSQN
jgi:hypothetical protein